MKRKPARTVSIAERGQTAQDFVVGIGLFMLAIAFVFTYFPTLLTPYSGPVGQPGPEQADRIAATIVADLEGDAPNELTDLDDLAVDEDELGLRSTDSVNVTIASLNDSDERYWRHDADDSYSNQTAASAGRIVTVDDPAVDEDDCDPACRLVVRVW